MGGTWQTARVGSFGAAPGARASGPCADFRCRERTGIFMSSGKTHSGKRHGFGMTLRGGNTELEPPRVGPVGGRVSLLLEEVVFLYIPVLYVISNK